MELLVDAGKGVRDVGVEVIAPPASMMGTTSWWDMAAL